VRARQLLSRAARAPPGRAGGRLLQLLGLYPVRGVPPGGLHPQKRPLLPLLVVLVRRRGRAVSCERKKEMLHSRALFPLFLSPQTPAPPAALPARDPHFLAYTFITDDLVFADGRTEMGAVGGSGPQAAWGFVLGCSLVGATVPAAVVAGVGPDLPASARAWLTAALGPSGDACLVPWQAATTPRAWQVLEADGRRTQVWRTPPSHARTSMLLPGPRALPAGVLAAARALHAGVDPSRPRDLAWAGAVRRAATPGAWLSLETFQEAASRPPAACLARLLGCATVFSPNEGELASLVGSEGGVVAGARRLMGRALAGGPLEGILVRCGAAGAVWVPRAPGEPVLAVPAALAGSAVRDTTGCGNAFLGAWTAARVVGRVGVGHALAVGAAAAAATAEVVGPPPAVAESALLVVARERMDAVRGRVVEVESGQGVLQ